MVFTFFAALLKEKIEVKVLACFYKNTYELLRSLLKPLIVVAFRKPPVIIKSNTVFELSSIIAGLWNILQNHKRLPECSNNGM
jgi:hypothetical protein